MMQITHKVACGTFLISVIFQMPPCAADTDITAAFAKCAITDNDQSRLRCYDKIRDDVVAQDAATSRGIATKYKSVTLIDLKTDIKSMIGQKVETEGVLQLMGDIVFLKSDGMDASPIMVSTDHVPRQERKSLLQSCTELCEGTVIGSIRNGPLGAQVNADHVVLK